MVAVAFGRSDSHHRDLCAITASPASTGEFALRFVDDSPLEDKGFELPVPRKEDNRRDLPHLSAAAAFRLWQSEQG